VKEPLLSVIVPVYNVENYLNGCLKTICGQTYSNLEIICVDDGSTDESGKLLDRWRNRDSRISVVHKENRGLVHTRKIGLLNSHGEYVTYVDSDDWIDLYMYENLMKRMIEENADVVTSGCYREYAGGKVIDREQLEPGVYKGNSLNVVFFSKIVGVEKFFEQNIKPNVCCKIFKRDMLIEYQMIVPEGISVGEDAAVSYPVLFHSNCVVVTGENYYHYRIRNDSVASIGTTNNGEAINLLEEHLYKTLKHREKDNPKITLQRKLICMFNRLMIVPETVIGIMPNGRIYPYNNLNIKDRVIVYGTSRYGTRLTSILERLGINVVGTADKNNKGNHKLLEAYSFDQYDKIVIGVLKANIVKEIERDIGEKGIPISRISTISISCFI